MAEPFRFLPGLDLLVAPADGGGPSPTSAISFDAASEGRLGELVAGADAPRRTWIVLDHHVSNTGFGALRLVDPDAAATAVVAARLLDRLGRRRSTRDIATCLYVGLATDTGSFKFDATTPEVLALAARLVAAGARPAEVARRVFDTRPFAGRSGCWPRCSPGPSWTRPRRPGGAWSRPTRPWPTCDRYGQPAHVLESFMDVVRTAEEADVACLVKPLGAGRWAVSLRSKGATDVAAVAVALGGGGHRLAAGFTGYGERVRGARRGPGRRSAESISHEAQGR